MLQVPLITIISLTTFLIAELPLGELLRPFASAPTIPNRNKRLIAPRAKPRPL
jgi:hypothetical protein